MRPAWSVIVFTVASGVGLGLLAWLGLLGALGHMPAASLAMPGGVALVLLSAGLVSSTFHLGNPRKAWRSLSCWRTSWLSREALLALLVYPLALAYLGLAWRGQLSVTLGLLTLVAALATIYCTGMIYACLRTVRAWNSPLVPLNYLLLGLGGGGVLLLSLAAPATASGGTRVVAAVVLAALAGRTASSLAAGRGGPSTLATALAVGWGRVRALEHVPDAPANYVDWEMRHREPALRLLAVRALALALGVATLAALLAGAGWMATLAMAAALLAERWLFFAEARHVVEVFSARR